MADFTSYLPVMRCYDPSKVGRGVSYHIPSGAAYTSEGNPAIPNSSDDEREVGRWELTSGDPEQPCAFVDMPLDPEGRGPGDPGHGELSLATVFAGDARCLVTNKALRFTGYAGRITNFGNASGSAILAFTVPLSMVTKVDAGRSNAFYTGNPIQIYLGEWGTVVAIVKAARANDKFRSGIFATAKNREFVAQIEAAVQGVVGEVTGKATRGADDTLVPTAVGTDIGGTRFFDLSTVAETSSAKPVEFECVSCGKAVDAGDRFCSYCGQDLTAV